MVTHMRQQKLYLCFLIFLFVAADIQAQELQRKGMIGVQPAPVDEAMAKEAGLPEPRGLRINNVVPSGTAAALGVKQGDILLKLNGIETDAFPQLIGAINTLWDGEKATAVVFRDGNEVALEGTVQPRPREQSTDTVEVRYDSIDFMDGKLSTILTIPKEGEKHPAILFIQGYPCSTVDAPSPNHPYRKLLYGLSERGYVVMRVEKPGMGDSRGTPDCQDLKILEETAAFEAGYDKLLTYDFVDTDNVFIFGHSMGGVSGPIIASKKKPKGIIVYGTTVVSWFEYVLDMSRFQNPRFGGDFADNDDRMRSLHTIYYEHYVRGKSLQDVAAMDPAYDSILREDFQWDGADNFLGRHQMFWQSINQLNLMRYWKDVDAYVYSVYGEADVQAVNPIGQQEIVDLVNHYRPGTAEFYLMPRTDHSFIEVGTIADSYAALQGGNYGQIAAQKFNVAVIELFDDWMRKTMAKDTPAMD